MKKGTLGLFILSLFVMSCNSSTEEQVAETIEIVEEQVEENGMENLQIETAHLLLKPALFKAKLENDSNVVLLDIRTPEELEENGSIAGAKNIDFYKEDFKTTIDAMSRETPLMLYCRSGGRSGEAAAMMKEMGFKQVFDLNGGYNAWLAAGF